jgi:hypothetical protein
MGKAGEYSETIVTPSGRTSPRYSPAPLSLKFVCRMPAGSLRELPPGQVLGCVRQIPAIEIRRAHPGVVNLDPVLFIPVLVVQAVLVQGQKFADLEGILRMEWDRWTEDKQKDNKAGWDRQIPHAKDDPL